MAIPNFVANTVNGSRQVTPQDLDNAFSGVIQTSGGTMQGPLLLAGVPSQAQEAASKAYVDAKTVPAKVATPVCLNVADFGAKSDGTTDDTSAIQGTIDNVFRAGGGQVYIPTKDHSHSGLILRHGVMLMGGAPTGFNGLGPDYPGSRLTLRPGSNRSSIIIPLKQNPEAKYPGNLYGTSNCGAYWINVDGNRTKQSGTSHGIEFESSNYVFNITGTLTAGDPTITGIRSTAGMEIGALLSGNGVPAGAYVASLTAGSITMNANATAGGSGVAILVNNLAVDGHDSSINFDHCYLHNNLSDGQRLSLGFRSVLNQNVTAKDNGGNGFSCLTSDNRYTNCISQVNGGSGFYIGSVSNRFAYCDSSVNNQNGFRIAATATTTGGNTIVACTADENLQEGIFNENLCYGTSVIGGLINDNGTSAASFADVYDGCGKNGVMLVGVTFGLPGKVDPNPVYHIYSAGGVEVSNCVFTPGASRMGAFQDPTKVRMSNAGGNVWIDAAGTMIFGNDVNFLRFGPGLIGSSQKIVATGGLGVGNAVPASTLGTVITKIEIFNDSGASLGFLPVYSSIA